MAIRVLLVEDNDSSVTTLDLLLGPRTTLQVVGEVGDGAPRSWSPCARAAPGRRDRSTTGCPASRGADDRPPCSRASPKTRSSCLTAVATHRTERQELLLAAGAAALVGKDEDRRREIVAAIRGAAQPPRTPMGRTAENTAIVLDSTADFRRGPRPPIPNWRVVPLYVRFGERDASATTSTSAPDDFYERLAAAPGPPTTSQPTPGDFLPSYEDLAPGLRPDPLPPALLDALGHVRRAQARRGAARR